MVCESSVARQVVDMAGRFALDHPPSPHRSAGWEGCLVVW